MELRGDANLDGALNLVDPIAVLQHLFVSVPVQCEDAADFNHDGCIDLDDVFDELSYLFEGGPPPSPAVAVCP